MANLDPVVAVRKRLISDSTVYGLVRGRIYPDSAPQVNRDGELRVTVPLPYIVLSRTETDHEHYMGGNAGLKHPHIQLDVFAKTRAAAENVAEKCRLVLDGFRGTVTIGANSLIIRKCFLKNDFSNFIQPQPGSNFSIRVVSHEYALSVPEVVPTFS